MSSLPTPRNDYEIVVPQDEEMPEEEVQGPKQEDQADIDARDAAELEAKRKFKLRKIRN